MDSYYPKYLKYKNKYLELKSKYISQYGGAQPIIKREIQTTNGFERVSPMAKEQDFKVPQLRKIPVVKDPEENDDIMNRDALTETTEERNIDKRVLPIEQVPVTTDSEDDIMNRNALTDTTEERNVEIPSSPINRIPGTEEDRNDIMNMDALTETEKSNSPIKRIPGTEEDNDDIMNRDRLTETTEEKEIFSPTSSEIPEDYQEPSPQKETNLPKEESGITSFFKGIKNFIVPESTDDKKENMDEDEEDEEEEEEESKQEVSPLVVNQSFDRGNLEKVKIIDGVEYNTYEEYNQGVRCILETCPLIWERTSWTTVKKD